MMSSTNITQNTSIVTFVNNNKKCYIYQRVLIYEYADFDCTENLFYLLFNLSEHIYVYLLFLTTKKTPDAQEPNA